MINQLPSSNAALGRSSVAMKGDSTRPRDRRQSYRAETAKLTWEQSTTKRSTLPGPAIQSYPIRHERQRKAVVMREAPSFDHMLVVLLLHHLRYEATLAPIRETLQSLIAGQTDTALVKS